VTPVGPGYGAGAGDRHHSRVCGGGPGRAQRRELYARRDAATVGRVVPFKLAREVAT